MGKVTAPEGRTFEERWPHDASDAEWLARPWVPVVLGGLGGMAGLPLFLAAGLLAPPVTLIVVLAVITLALTLLLRLHPRSNALRRLWRVATWTWVATAIGVVVGIATGTLCGGVAAEAACLERRASVPALVVFALLVGASTAAAAGIDRLGRRLEHRFEAAGPASGPS